MNFLPLFSAQLQSKKAFNTGYSFWLQEKAAFKLYKETSIMGLSVTEYGKMHHFLAIAAFPQHECNFSASFSLQ